MEKHEAQRILDGLLEELAAIEHQRWAHWQRYMHSKGQLQADGSLILPPDLVSQWERQMATTYANLSEIEKESDRDQVRLYLPILKSALISYEGITD